MKQDKQKNIPSFEQGEMKAAEQPADLDVKRKEIERLRQEITEMEKGLQGKRFEAGEQKVETRMEEGKTGAEVSESYSAPAGQIQKPSQQIQNLDPQNQIKALCDLAFQKGLDFSIKTARGLNNAYILDALHDTLIDKLYERLKGEGKIKAE